MEQPIETSVRLRSSLASVRALIAHDPGVVVTTAATDDERRDRRFHTELAVDLGAGTSVKQEIVVQLGVAVATAHAVRLPVRWEPTGHQPLFPTFEGDFVVSVDRSGPRLALRGRYTIPLGWVGRLGDGVVGKRLARRVLTAHLEGVARRLDDEVASRGVASAPKAGLASVDLDSENFIG